jgi:prefoldin subunit 5
MAKLDEQIETLQEKLKQLKVRQQAVENRKKAISAMRERKADIRRKILIGAVVMAKVDQKNMDAEQLQAWLDQALSRPDDRAPFNLPPRSPMK